MRNYNDERMQKVSVRGIICEFNDSRLDRASVPEGKFLYEVADDDSDGEPARIRPRILVNFLGSLVCDKPLERTEEDGKGDVIWLMEGDWQWID